jgi:hypothetical protein
MTAWGNAMGMGCSFRNGWSAGDRMSLTRRIFSLRLINLSQFRRRAGHRAPKTAAKSRPGLLTPVKVRLRFGQPGDLHCPEQEQLIPFSEVTTCQPVHPSTAPPAGDHLKCANTNTNWSVDHRRHVATAVTGRSSGLGICNHTRCVLTVPHVAARQERPSCTTSKSRGTDRSYGSIHPTSGAYASPATARGRAEASSHARDARLGASHAPIGGVNRGEIPAVERMPTIFVCVQNGGGRVSADEPAGQRPIDRDLFPRELTARKKCGGAFDNRTARRSHTPYGC